MEILKKRKVFKRTILREKIQLRKNEKYGRDNKKIKMIETQKIKKKGKKNIDIKKKKEMK